jgi:hypothetical protein
MATEPPRRHPATARKPDDRAGTWQVAWVQSAGAMIDRQPPPRTLAGCDFVAVRDPIGPVMAPDDRAGGDRDAVLPLSGSWPRVFPGL